jgi:hypothetical protein
LAPLFERFSPEAYGAAGPDEVPDFQKHVSPLFGKLGCNGRACHGSFQGQGGFQLSLFGYDFEADHKALLEKGAARVDLEDKLESLILTKPVNADEHEGGKRFEQGGWEYWVLRKWIEQGAPYSPGRLLKLERLEVTPSEIVFSEPGQSQGLTAIAVWQDGTREDVTCLCRFHSNDEAIAMVDERGMVTIGEAGDTHVVVSYDNAVVPVQTLRPLSNQSGSNYPPLAFRTPIDRLVGDKLKKLGVVPSELCTDAEFLRRASLDVTGTLPAASEVLEFVADTSADKRARKIEELLDRPGYAAQWTTFLCDMTGNNEDQLRNFLPQNVRPENQWYQWIYSRVRDNIPYDEIVEGIVTAASRKPDESYQDYCQAMSEICREGSGEKFAERPGLVHYWARNNFKTTEDRAIGFAYSFLGVRIQCAQCHKHPFDQWSKADFDNFQKLFGAVQASQNTLAPDAKKSFDKMVVGLEVDKSLKGNLLRRELGELLKQGKVIPFPELTVREPPKRGKKDTTKGEMAKLLGSDWVEMDQADVRGTLMDWLRDPSNPYFTKAIVNRVWTQYFEAGIVNPPDDLNLANAPSNAPLLSYLADQFVAEGYDLRWLHREILNSDTYQRSWIPNETNALDKHNFSRSRLRRLPAEATYDAVRMALVKDEAFELAQALEVERAITKPGASARETGNDDLSYALSVFGRSVRESNCDCDRSAEPSLLQTVFMVNDSAVQEWLQDSKNGWVSSVAEMYGWEKSSAKQELSEPSPQVKAMLEQLKQKLDALDQRLSQAKKKKRKEALASLEEQKQKLVQQAKAYAKKHGLPFTLVRSAGSLGKEQAVAESGLQASGPSDDRMTEEQALWIAENAYLRTLSRKPNTEELDLAMAFLRTDGNKTAAVEGLMWSLINTKEFILNH